MVAIRPSEKVQLQENEPVVEVQSLEGFSPDLEEPNNENAQGSALHQVFSKDTLYDIPGIEVLSYTVEMSKTPSFWSKIFSWLYQPNQKTETRSTSSEIDLLEAIKPEPISPVPALDEPDCIAADLAAAKILSDTEKSKKEKLSQSQLIEGLSLMSSLSIEKITYIILKGQIELENENANIIEGTFSKYQNFKKLQIQMLKEIKDVLAKDEKVAGYFKTAKNIALAASFLCAMAVAILTCGTHLPGIIPMNLMAAATPLAAVGTPVSAGFTGLVTGSNAYFKFRGNQNKAEHAKLNYHDKYYSDRVDETRQRLIETAESDNVFKERWINLIKRFQKMSQLVQAK